MEVSLYWKIRESPFSSPAGANRVDQEVVVDNGLIASRKPADLPAFNRAMVGEFSKAKHQGALAAR